MSPLWWTRGALALLLFGIGACGREPHGPEVAPALAPASAGAPRTAGEALARRSRHLANYAFWNQPRSIAELGISAGERQRLDAILADYLEPLQARNQAHREAVAAWIAALARGDTETASRHFARAAELVAAGARENLLFKGRLLAELTPEARARLAKSYPRFLVTGWVRANRMIDSTDLGKWSGPLPAGPPARLQGQAGEPTEEVQ